MNTKALYAGSFDPITNGHLDIIKRGSTMYDKLVVGVITNPSKVPFLTIEEKKEVIKEATKGLGNVEVDDFTGLLADYVNQKDFNVVIRGLRANMDFESEMQMAHMNSRLYKPNIETVFLMTHTDYSFVSSSLIKEVFKLGGDITGLVPENVLKFMEEKYRKNK